MKLKLDFDITPPDFKMDIQHRVMLVGSCFAEHIGERLAEEKWKVFVNPHGILFNPVSIFNGLFDYLTNQEVVDEDLVQVHDVWYSWNHHGDFCASGKEHLMTEIVVSKEFTNAFLNETACVVVSLGSAWVYELKTTNQIVANCHKVPQNQFNKRLLTVKEIEEAYNRLREHPSMKQKKIIFTVSPVRYTRDGLVENNRSKAVLIQAVQNLVASDKDAYYFPAYEIMVDELRDYRFYSTDMVHPNEQGISYVYERFSETVFSTETKQILKEISEIEKAKNHKPILYSSNESIAFRKNCFNKTKALQQKYPFLHLQQELEYFTEV